MSKEARFKGRSVASLSETEAKAALAELLHPEKAEAAPRVPPRVWRAGLSPAREPDPSPAQPTDSKEVE